MKRIIFIAFVISLSQEVFGQDNTYNIMPLPQSIKPNGQKVRVTALFTVAVIGNPGQRVYAEASRALRRLDQRVGFFFKQGFITAKDYSLKASLLIDVKRPAELKLNEDESYQLTITDRQIKISALTDFGVIRGLETLLQMLSVDASGYYFPGAEIQDFPRFPWRGLLLDVCLHWMPMDVVKRTLDGMAAVKMNVFHFHFSEDQAFRVESKVFPKLTELGAEGDYYTQEDVKEMIAYASQRGIRVVPEIDVPGHATAMIKAYPELASIPREYELQRYYGVFDPSLDVTKEYTYEFLDKLFGEMAQLFPDEYFHIGGDENTGKNWENSPSIREYMRKNNIKNAHDLQTEFNKRLLPMLTKYGKKVMGWDEILQPGVPKDIIIQSWQGGNPYYESLKKGYTSLLSSGYYIDLIQPADYHYLVDPAPEDATITDEQRKLILGGEATMWTEHTTTETVDSRIWPRTAAIAERLWSSQNVRDVEDMYRRLDIISLRLEELGSTHIKNKSMLMRRLANGYNTEALEVLVDVIEPLKIYQRNQGDTMYTVFSPYTKLADVATPDQRVAREFRKHVSQYVKSKDKTLEKNILDHLLLWKGNHSEFLKLIQQSPTLQEAEILSENLARIAQVGIDAIGFINGKQIPQSWHKESQLILQEAKQQGGRCDLQVTTAIDELVNAVKN
ncbi:MAG: family 20 glycosylhydrolase [Bacteroidota bacterium]